MTDDLAVSHQPNATNLPLGGRAGKSASVSSSHTVLTGIGRNFWVGWGLGKGSFTFEAMRNNANSSVQRWKGMQWQGDAFAGRRGNLRYIYASSRLGQILAITRTRATCRLA